MKSLHNYTVIWVLAVLMAGCATMAAPQTNLERLSYLEISYGVILDKATLYANEGRLSDDQKERLNEAFNQYESARDLAKIAIDAVDQGGFDNQTAVMTTVLSTLRTIVAEVE